MYFEIRTKQAGENLVVRQGAKVEGIGKHHVGAMG